MRELTRTTYRGSFTGFAHVIRGGIEIEEQTFQSRDLCLCAVCHKLVYANLSKTEIKAAQK